MSIHGIWNEVGTVPYRTPIYGTDVRTPWIIFLLSQRRKEKTLRNGPFRLAKVNVRHKIRKDTKKVTFIFSIGVGTIRSPST